MIKVQVNLDKVDKSLIYQGKNGKYLNLVLWDNRAGRDKYGNDGMVKQEVSKDQRLAGKESQILGNWKHHVSGQEMGTNANLAAKKAQAAERDDSGPLPFRQKPSVNMGQDDDIPF
jgi:hypothetical protein